MYARIYTRVSTDEQAITGFSLRGQQERLEAFCKSQGWEIAGRYIDEGESAKDLNRPEFQRLLAEVDEGEVVLVYKLDRLTRSVRDLDDLMREFDSHGVLFRSATEQFDTTTATGRLFIRMVAEMAQWERETIAERATFGKRKKATLGEWAGGAVPIGYSTVPSEQVKAGRTLLKLIPDPERWHLIPLIYERYLAGHGIRGISVWLNKELGVRTQRGCRFHQLTISRILTNPVYCGDLEYGRRTKRPRMRVRGSHEPLIAREVFERVQELMSVHKLHAPRQATGMYPLSGVAKCGVCGGRIDGQRRSEGQRKRVYKCHNYAIGTGCGGDGERSLTNVVADRIEEALICEIERLYKDPDALDSLLREYQLQADDRNVLTQSEKKRMETDLTEAEMAVERWKRLFEKGHIEDDEFMAEIRPHRDRIKLLKEKLAEYADQHVDLPERETFGEFAVNFRDSWAGLEPREQKVLLQRFVGAFKAEIVILPGRQVEIRPAL